MTRRYDPSPVQLQLFMSVAPPPVPVRGPLCPVPTRHTQDQYRCAYCGLVWDIDEPRPPCDGPDHHP
jgi:hypothetical protein